LSICIELGTERTDGQRRDVDVSFEKASETIGVSSGAQQETSQLFIVYKSVCLIDEECVRAVYTVSQKTSPTFIAITRKSIHGFLPRCM